MKKTLLGFGFVVIFLLITMQVVSADTPPPWTGFTIQSQNGRYTAEVSALVPMQKYQLKIYDTNVGAKKEIWSSDYQYDGYPGGILSDDGTTFVYVNIWYSEDQPLVRIYRGEWSSPRQLRGREFNLDLSAVVETASHRIWLSPGAPYRFINTDKSSLALELTTAAGSRRIIDLVSGNVIDEEGGVSGSPPSSDNLVCTFDTDCAWGSGLPERLGGCGCFNRTYLTKAKEYEYIMGESTIECEPPPWQETACVCDVDACRLDTLTQYEAGTISKSQALYIAKRECEKAGYEWKDAAIEDAKDAWIVNTGGLQMGGDAEIHIDKKTGDILGSNFNPE